MNSSITNNRISRKYLYATFRHKTNCHSHFFKICQKIVFF